MDIKKTEIYYQTRADETLCSCDYCRNYYREIKGAYPLLSDYLKAMGIDIEKPFEAMPLEPFEGRIEYIAAQYIVMGDSSDFMETDISGVHIGIADSHPMTDIGEEHFVIELSPITLNWTIEDVPGPQMDEIRKGHVNLLTKTEWQIERLLETPYWIIDILPKQVPKDSPGQYLAVEQYFLKIPAIAEKKTELLLKLNCYYDLQVVTDTEELVNPSPEVLAEMVRTSCFNILVDNAMIATDFGDNYMTLYNPDEDLLSLVRQLAASAGFFVWKPEGV